MGPDAAHILFVNRGLWDTGQIMVNMRRDAFDRLPVGSMCKGVGTKDRGSSHRWAKKRVARTFPTPGPVEFEGARHGKIAMTPDHLLRIHALDTNLSTPIGDNGRGITTGTMFVETMAGLLTGTDRADMPLRMTKLTMVSSELFLSRIYRSAFTTNQNFKSI